jgi:flagellar biosynthetic protein FliQ
MTSDTVVSLAVQAMTVALKVSMPFLVAGLTVGLLVSIFQAVTSIQEQTLTFIPKLIVTGAVILLAGPWMISQMVSYTQGLYTSIPSMVGP